MKSYKNIIVSSILMIISLHSFSQNCVQCSGTIVTGETASAIGINNTASGKASFAGGIDSEAIEKYTLAFGDSAKAWSRNGIALGKNASVFGPYSFGVGENVKTMITSSMVIGSGFDDYNPLINNISKSLMIGFYSNKPTLFIGGATGNGLTGKIGIGDVTDPQAKLHIKADDGEAAMMFIEPHSFTGGESAKLRLGTMDYGISSGSGKLYFVTGGNYVFNSANAKVGIGTLTPTEKLEVAGNIKASGTGYMMTSKVQAVDNKGLSLTNTLGKGIIIANDGKVGIGTISALTEKLEVNGNIKQAAGYKMNTQEIRAIDANGLKLYNLNGSGIVINSSGNVGIGTNPTTNRLEVSGTLNASYYTGNGSLLTDVKDYRWQNTYNSQISTNGKVIIGYGNYTGTDLTDITDPQLDVRAMEEYNHKLANFVDSDGRRIFLVTKIDGYNSIASVDDAGIFWSDSQEPNSNQNEYAGFVIGPHRGGTAKGIKIDKDGNVGIGKAVPTAMLDVAGDAKIGGLLESNNINVSGTIDVNILEADIFDVTQLNTVTFSVTDKLYAGEIHVQNIGEWKDCVFENSYKLMSLKETEAFIEQNKHLPGIPSEKEVLDNGINVSEMNALLLQKIEELTLHIIELEKRLNNIENN